MSHRGAYDPGPKEVWWHPCVSRPKRYEVTLGKHELGYLATVQIGRQRPLSVREEYPTSIGHSTGLGLLNFLACPLQGIEIGVELISLTLKHCQILWLFTSKASR